MDLSTVHDFNHLTNHAKFTQRRQWQPTPVLLPGQSHGWRSLAGCSPWGWYELDMTKSLHFHLSLSCTGEGMATHSSILAWRIPGKGKPGGLTSMGWHRVGQDWRDLAAAAAAKFTMVYILYYTLFYYTISYHTRLFYSMADAFLPPKSINLIST